MLQTFSGCAEIELYCFLLSLKSQILNTDAQSPISTTLTNARRRRDIKITLSERSRYDEELRNHVIIQLNVTIRCYPLRFAMSSLYTNFVNQLKPCRPLALQRVRVNSMALITGIIVSYLLPIPSLHEAIYVVHARRYDPEALLYRRFCIFGMSLYPGYAEWI